jgi:uncharacterized membrane protein
MTRWRGRAAIAILAALGVLISLYLTWLHFSGSLALCIGVGGCETVQASRYATIGSVPVAAIGIVGFAVMLILAIAGLRGALERTAMPLFAASLAATLYVAYLTYVEVFVLGAICPWCVSVAVCALAIFAVALNEVWRAE